MMSDLIRFENKVRWVAPRDPFELISWARMRDVDLPNEPLTTTSWPNCILLGYVTTVETIHGPSRISRVLYLRCDTPTPEGIGEPPVPLVHGIGKDGDDWITPPALSIQSRSVPPVKGPILPQTISGVETWHRIYQEFYSAKAAIESGICNSPADDDYDANYRLTVAAETGIVWNHSFDLIQHTHHVHETLQRTPCHQMAGMLVLGHSVTDRRIGRVFALPCGTTGFEKNPIPTPGWRLISPRSIAIGKPARPPGMRWWYERSIKRRLAALHIKEA